MDYKVNIFTTKDHEDVVFLYKQDNPTETLDIHNFDLLDLEGFYKLHQSTLIPSKKTLVIYNIEPKNSDMLLSVLKYPKNINLVWIFKNLNKESSFFKSLNSISKIKSVTELKGKKKVEFITNVFNEFNLHDKYISYFTDSGISKRNDLFRLIEKFSNYLKIVDEKTALSLLPEVSDNTLIFKFLDNLFSRGNRDMGLVQSVIYNHNEFVVFPLVLKRLYSTIVYKFTRDKEETRKYWKYPDFAFYGLDKFLNTIDLSDLCDLYAKVDDLLKNKEISSFDIKLLKLLMEWDKILKS